MKYQFCLLLLFSSCVQHQELKPQQEVWYRVQDSLLRQQQGVERIHFPSMPAAASGKERDNDGDLPDQVPSGLRLDLPAPIELNWAGAEYLRYEDTLAR